MTRIVALGAGRMGRGIGHVFAYAGYRVDVIDFKARSAADGERLRAAARAEIAANLALLRDLGVLDEAQRQAILGRIRVLPLEDAKAALAEADVVFEGVTETLEAKRDAFARACALARPDTILASTTSSMLADTLAALVPRPERFINAHFLNPAYLIPLVEVSPAKTTAQGTFDKMKALLESAGKVVVRCAPSPGFIVPRLQAAAMNEAARLVEEGVATPEDIDRAVRAGFGPRYTVMGMCEFIDYGGLDILYYASKSMAHALDAPRYAPPAIVERLMREGKRGAREGEGLADWRGRDMAAYQKDLVARFVTLFTQLKLLPPPGQPIDSTALIPEEEIHMKIRMLVAACAAAFVPLAAHAAEVKLKAASFLPVRSIVAKQFVRFVEETNQQCAGKVNISIVGPEAVPSLEQWNAVKNGVIDMHYGPPNYWRGVVPAGDVISVARNESAEQRANGAWAMINEEYNRKLNAYYLTHLFNGVRFHLYTTKPAQGGKFEGMRLRSVPIYDAFFKSLGAQPLRMAPPDVYTALERNTVEGYGWPLWGIQDFGWDKYTKFRHDPGFISAAVAIIVNLDKWKGLEADQRACLTKMSLWVEGEWPKWRAAEDAVQKAAQEKSGLKAVDMGAEFATQAEEIYWQDLAKGDAEFVKKIRPLLSGK